MTELPGRNKPLSIVSCKARGRRVFRGTQREYSSKPLKHSIVKRILVLNGKYKHIFIPYNFFIRSDFLA